MKIVKVSIAIVLLCAANMPAMAASNICEDYHQAIMDNCSSGTGGISSGSIGACIGAQIGALVHGC